MTFFFDFVFLLFLLLATPKAIKRRLSNPDYKGMFIKRFYCGRFKSSVSHPTIWLNGVSVGEVVSLSPLVKQYEKHYPGIQLVISVTTGTGYKRAKALYPNHFVIAYPFDFSFIVRFFLNRIQPSLFISAELDLWPNFLTACKSKGIPYVVVSGRISERSVKGYERIRFLFADALNSITKFMAQDKIDAERASRMGLTQDKVSVQGNLKFDLIDVSEKEIPEKLNHFFNQNSKTFVSSSTHDPEEKWIADMFSSDSMIKCFDEWRWIMVPRHPERAQSLKKMLEQKGFEVVLYSELEHQSFSSKTVLLVDQIGVLPLLYQRCDLCYMGGSLIPHGSQNMIEPAAWGIPVFLGPSLHTFREASDFLIKNDAVIRIDNMQDFEKKLQQLLENLDERVNIGTRAKDTILKQRGVSQRIFNTLETLLKG